MWIDIKVDSQTEGYLKAYAEYETAKTPEEKLEKERILDETFDDLVDLVG